MGQPANSIRPSYLAITDDPNAQLKFSLSCLHTYQVISMEDIEISRPIHKRDTDLVRGGVFMMAGHFY